MSYQSWAEMKAEGIEIETMQEYIDEVRGFNDHPPDPPEPGDDDNDGREYEDDPQFCPDSPDQCHSFATPTADTCQFCGW